MPVQFKFRGEKAFRTLLNVTTPCTLQRVKHAIYEQARISDQTTDLALEDPVSGGVLSARALLVQETLVQVIVRRIPVQNRVEPLVSLAASSDDAVDDELEDQAIDRMVEQHDIAGIAPASSSTLVRYSRSYRLAVTGQARQREGYDLDGSDDDDAAKQEEPPPPGYTCHRCGMTGGKPESHWIWECPTNEDPDHMKKVRTARGVPRQFLQKVATVEEGQALSDGGVTFTLPGHSGHYIIAHQNASVEEQKRRLGDTVQEKVTTAFTEGAKMLTDSLKCPLCNQLFRQAVLAPCCGTTFCSDCVVDRLAHSSVEHGKCPGCGKEVLAHQLVANEDIRKQVQQVSRASKESAVVAQKISVSRSKSFEVDTDLKDRVNRPKKFADEGTASGSSDARPLALTDGSVSDQPAPGEADSNLWRPLGFGPMLSPEQFAYWQQAVRAGVPPQAKAQFTEWQQKMRQAPPTNPVPMLPSKEAFEAWQKQLRELGPDAPAAPASFLPAAVAPGVAHPAWSAASPRGATAAMPAATVGAAVAAPAPGALGSVAAPGPAIIPMAGDYQEPRAKKAKREKKEKKSRIAATDL